MSNCSPVHVHVCAEAADARVARVSEGAGDPIIGLKMFAY
jgi:hypothetical protein